MTVKWLLSVFSSARARHRVPPPVLLTPSFYFSRGTRKNARRQVARRKREKDEGRGDPSCVVLPESSVNSVGPRCRVVCGMPRCLTSRRDVPCETPWEAREEDSVYMRTTACRTPGRASSRQLYTKPPREMLEGPWSMHSRFFARSSRYPLDGCRYDFWHLEFSALPTCVINETWPTSSWSGSFYETLFHILSLSDLTSYADKRNFRWTWRILEFLGSFLIITETLWSFAL